MTRAELTDLPGHELVLRGVDDASSGRATAAAALVFVASGRLRELGVPIPTPSTRAEWELVLYQRLAEDDPRGDTYATYGAWLDDLDAFLEALDARVGRARDGARSRR